MMSKKKISILGSTGSIGLNALDILDKHRDRFELVAITAWTNAAELKKQIIRHRPKLACIMSEELALELESDPELKGTRILWGPEGLLESATRDDIEMVVSAIVGSAGLPPTFAAVQAGKDIALANKETLVAAGSIIMKEAGKTGAGIFPVDSEHSAIFQSLAGQRREDVKRLILTASGGPFRLKSIEELKSVGPEAALSHPTWSMGSKISIDSATLMNKGLEIIEARWLFDVDADFIDVVVHPESIVHSMVEYMDGSVISQMGSPDMKGPIAYALSWPERLDAGSPRLDLVAMGPLTFFKPDTDKFPALKLCYKALKIGGTAPCVLSAANEIAVEAFLNGKIGFMMIATIVERVLSLHEVVDAENIDQVLGADHWARRVAAEEIIKIEKRGVNNLC
ncbi:MAG: 1-deoxy-D-xylulose-5-phosphate reductoisomerase [bacterium]|nr:1-deoxy-D-xylulose-5-phosphate reductoisomerase [bacterium]